MKYSENIKAFLDFLREARRDYAIAGEDVTDADNATQDILHSLELEDNSYHQAARLSLALRDIRQKRREAKDREEQLQYIMSWMTTFPNAVKDLEKMLGATRKAEKSTESRHYCKKTDIVSKTLGDRQKKEDT